MIFLKQVTAIILSAFIIIAAESSTVVLPVNKLTDAAKPLFSIQTYVKTQKLDLGCPTCLDQQTFIIDLDAPFIWRSCIPQQESCPECPPQVTCRESQCTDLRTTYSYKSPLCPPPTNQSKYEGYYDCELCPVNAIHPLTGLCDDVIVTSDQFVVDGNNGRNVIFDNAACAPPWAFNTFPGGVTGVMALSTSLYALLPHFPDTFEKKLGLCLPSTVSAHGGLSYGTVDTSLLSYTPLIKHPVSFGYFIGVNDIVIKTRSINVPANTTAKISTIDPYTVLRTDIYNNVVQRFSKVTKRIPRVKPVAPFGLCFNSTGDVGIKVPDVELILGGGNKWAISTANSITKVADDVVCLAFVDGGATSEHAIVIGTFQFEDNFVLFNLENSTFGFSSSLLHKQTSCSSFHL